MVVLIFSLPRLETGLEVTDANWRGKEMATQSGASTTATVATSAAAPLHPLPRQRVALPLHVQKLQGALSLDRFIDQVERAFNESLSLEKSVRYAPFLAQNRYFIFCVL